MLYICIYKLIILLMNKFSTMSDELLKGYKFIFTNALKKSQIAKDKEAIDYYLLKLSEVDVEILLRKQPKQVQA